MPYEIDFLPVGNGCSGDAIAMRYLDTAENRFKVLVIDGGTQESGEELVRHLRSTYAVQQIDYVVSTHPDNDHASGLRPIFESFLVKELWLHVPWLHASETHALFENPNWTAEALSAAIKREYPIIAEILNTASKSGTTVYEPFQGSRIGPFTVLSPSRTMYNNLLPLFRDTPKAKQNIVQALSKYIAFFGQRVASVILDSVHEHWGYETLREGGMTSAENESSVVLYGDIDERGVLFTADAGNQALAVAANFAAASNIDFGKLRFLQIPHHGSRNNISPSALNRMLGAPLTQGIDRGVTAYVSAGEADEDHPRKVVVNAFIRRGANVFPTRGKILNHRYGTQPRAGWINAQSAGFSNCVEEYD